jgi:DNA-binding transcriptional MerR regulator/effector-binding domain-containing protein
MAATTPVPDVTLTVGEFSRITYLSVKTLHHYHEIGLLPPATIDPANGYRRYAVDQVPTAQLIRRLRDLDMPIDDVRAVLDATDPAARDEAIAAHLRRMEQQLVATRATVESLRTLLEHRSVPGAVAFRLEPARATLAISGLVAFGEVEGWLEPAYQELHDAILDVGARADGPDGALYHDELFQRGEGLVVAFVPLSAQLRAGPPRGRVTPTELPATALAVSLHEGPFADLDQAYAALGAYLAARAVPTTGPVREHYLATDDEDPPRTEVCWPVAGLPDARPRRGGDDR